MIEVLVEDLQFVNAEAIARPVTADLEPTTALTRRIVDAAGDAMARQLNTSEPLAVGSAVVTGAGALHVELMIHAVVRSADEPVTVRSVWRATLSALQRCADWKIAHLALPPFGLGAGNLEIEASADAMMDAIVEHRGRSPLPSRITVVVESEDEARAFRARMPAAPESTS